MRKARRREKKSNRSVLIVVILMAAIGGGLLGLHFWEQRQLSQEAARLAESDDYTLTEPLTVYYNGQWYQLRNSLDTYLILGIDKFEDTKFGSEESLYNNQQADFLVLLIVDQHNHSCSALHLNRDTMTEVQRLGLNGAVLGGYEMQLALAHSYGSGGKDSCRNTVKAVSRLLYDVPVEHYFAVTMGAIPVLNDLAGGVTVHIDEDLTNADAAFIEGTDVRLWGEQALHFVRARMGVSDGTNLSRMKRQRVYMNALYDQLLYKLDQSGSFALQMAEALSPYTTSDLITDELATLIEQFKDYQFNGIEDMEGEAVVGEQFMEFYPDEASLQEQVIRLFFEPQKAA